MNSTPSTQRRERGIALYTVLIIVILSTLLALWASRTAWFSEIMVGNDVDYQRAFEAAQAMLQDAEQDIRGVRPDGSACTPSADNTSLCRAGIPVYFIEEEQDFTKVLTAMDGEPTGAKCLYGICQKRSGAQDFWNDPEADQSKNIMTLMTGSNAAGAPRAARYGTYTGAMSGSKSNPILAITDAGKGAWYWVEMMQYHKNAAGANLINNSATTPNDRQSWDLNLKPYVVYRVTAVARGLKPSTQVVLQTTIARQKLAD
ncbi:MAG: pilus assembly protein PilX [Burkholderiaceae bacterium]|jgi:type IV pilus assembly protein PilX|nr:pilus assembly protein PilX [Burkholderiaceae bacterium]